MPHLSEDGPRLPFDAGWFTPRQWEHMANVVAKPGGFDVLVGYYQTVQARVDQCRDCQCTPGRTIRQVMACTRGGHPGIDQSDLIPITRGMLNVIFQEVPE
jgi:hypothetical protein